MTALAPARRPATTRPRTGPPPASPTPQAGLRSRRFVWAAQLIAALCVLAAASSIASMMVGTVWWIPTGMCVGVVAVVGIVARLGRIPGAVRILAQLLALIGTLALLFGITSLSGAEAAIVEAVDQIRSSQPPVIVSSELSFLIAAAVGLLAVMADAVVERWPALVAVPILIVFLIGSTVARGQLPWYSFALPALGYVLLLIGRGVGWHRSRPTPSPGQALPAVGMAAVAITVALVATGAMTGVSTLGRVDRSDRSQGISGPSPFTQLVGDLRQVAPIDLLRVTWNSDRRYLRTLALDAWTNDVGWSLGEELRNDGYEPPSLTDPISTVPVRIESLAYQGTFLPVPERSAPRSSLSQWEFDEQRTVWHRTDPANPGSLDSLAMAPPDPADLMEAAAGEGGANLEVGEIDPEVARIAAEVTAGAGTPYAKALALQQWFTTPSNGFVYNLSVPTGSSGDRLLDFLQLKQGYCEQFASAMAVMLRSQGVPARVALGFGPGTQVGENEAIVNTHNAHAWVEVLLEDVGWVSLAPTPGGPGGNPTFTDGDGDGQAPVDEEALPDPNQNAPTIDGAATDPAEVAGDDGGTTAAEPDEADGVSLRDVGLGALRIAGVVALLVLVLRGPRWVRALRHRRRQALVRAGGPAAAGLAWREIEDLGIDHGRALDSSRSVRVEARVLAKDLRLTRSASDRVNGVVRAIEQDWYAAPPMADAADAQDAADAGPGAEAREERGEQWANAVSDVSQGYAITGRTTWWQYWFPPSLLRRD